MGEYRVEVEGLYLPPQTFDVEAETSDEALINGKRAWFDDRPGFMGIIKSAHLVTVGEQAGDGASRAAL